MAVREVLVAVVDGFEFRAVDRNARLRQQAHLAAQLDELRTDLLDRRAVVLAEIGDRLVIRRQPSEQPHHLEIALALALEPPARLDAIEIAVDVELEVQRRVVAGPADVGRLGRLEAQLVEIERLDERIDDANRIALVDPLIEAFRQQRQLPPIDPFDEPRHAAPADSARES